MHKSQRLLRIPLLVIAVAVVLFGAVMLFNHFQRPHLIVVDGSEIVLRGSYDSVKDVVVAAGIELRSEDSIWPPLSSPPPATEPITIRVASPVELTINGQTTTVWTHQATLASFIAESDIVLDRTSIISADNSQVPIASLADTELGRSVNISYEKEIAIREGQQAIPVQTKANTVGQLLIDLGIDIYSADRVEPALNAWLRPGDQISIHRAAPITLQVDGRELKARTDRDDVASILAETGIGLVGRDEAWPGLDHELAAGETIKIGRAQASYQVTELTLPYSSYLQPQDNLELDQRSLVASGLPGTLSQLTRIEANSVDPISPTMLVSPTLLGEWTSLPASDEILGYGTNIVLRSIDTPDGPLSYWRVVRMRVTAYTAADAGKPRSHPAYGITASGRPAGFGIVAVDPDVVPFRSQVYVPGYGVALAGDTGGGVKGRWIDLGYDEGEIVTWNGYVDVYYLAPVPEPDHINYLIPSALP